MNSATAALSLRDLSKVYPGGAHALDSFSLDASATELVSIVGPSGSGKSTLLKLIAGLESPTSGEIRVRGEEITRRAPQDRQMALLFQSYTLFPHLTAYENIVFGLKVRGVPESERRRRAEQTAERLGVAHLLGRRPRALSGGERQRVALARALLREPAVFLLDEPLASLDAPLRQQLRLEIKRLHRESQRPMLFVTHDQAEAMMMGDRVVVLHQGRIQQAGEPLAVYDRPANRFVAGFIGAPGMNLLEGAIEETPSGLSFRGTLLAFTLPPELARRLPVMPGHPVLAGIRPEALLLVAESKAGPGAFPALVQAQETAGAFSTIYAEAGGAVIAVSVPGAASVRPGDRVHLRPDLSRLSLFDASNGEALA